MRFNSKKCYILSVKNKSQHYYSLGGLQNNPYLGIEFSEDLKWSSHISKITKKQTQSLASSVGTCHIAQQNVDGMLISYGTISY